MTRFWVTWQAWGHYDIPPRWAMSGGAIAFAWLGGGPSAYERLGMLVEREANVTDAPELIVAHGWPECAIDQVKVEAVAWDWRPAIDDFTLPRPLAESLRKMDATKTALDYFTKVVAPRCRKMATYGATAAVIEVPPPIRAEVIATARREGFNVSDNDDPHGPLLLDWTK